MVMVVAVVVSSCPSWLWWWLFVVVLSFDCFAVVVWLSLLAVVVMD